MKKSTVSKLFVCLFLVAAYAVHGAVIRDDFSVAHDYLADGVAGTVWDGFFYNFTNGNAVVSIANADSANAGRLTFRSTNGSWENGDADGILLYKTVAGDFDAMVRVVSMNNVQWHDAGIMARVADPEAAGPGEDWVAVKHFAQGGMNGHRSVDGNVTTTVQVPGLQPWLRLSRVGNLFVSYRSADGVSWSQISSTVRSDMDGLPVQVGLWHATFSANEGTAVFDDFIVRQPEVWTLSGGGSWGEAGNWTNALPDAASEWAVFPNTITNNSRITLDGDRKVGWLTFNVTNGASCNIEAGTTHPDSVLTIDEIGDSVGFPSVEVRAGNHGIAVPLSLSNGVTFTTANGTSLALQAPVSGKGDLIKTGVGRLTLSSTNRYDGATRIKAGSLGLASIPSGTKAYYRFDSASNLGLDSSGLNNDISAVSAPSYSAAGKYGGAVYLNGSSYFTRSVFPAGVPVGSSPYTIALWLKDDGSPNAGGFCGWGSNSALACNNFRLSGSNGLNNYWYGSGNDFNLTGLGTNLKDGQWHHVAVTWDGWTRIIYVDGSPVGSYVKAGLNAQAVNFVVGKTTADVAFKGWMDNLLIADRALGAAEIDALMREVRSGNPLPAGTAVDVGVGGILDINGCSQSIGGLSGAGRVMNGSAVPATLTVGAGNASSSFAGALGGPLTLVKTGAGALTLSGVCGQTGGTLVSGGKLVLSTKSLDALLAGSRAWFDAADAGTLTTNAAGQVTLWKNKGTAGAGLDAVQVTSGVGPTVLTNALNGRPVLSVEGTTALRTTNKLGIYGAADRTLFAVGSRQNNSSNFLAHVGEIGAANKAFGIASQVQGCYAYTWNNDIAFAARPNGVPEIYDFVIANGAGSASVISEDGVLSGTKTLAPNTTDTVLYMGSRGTAACWGHVAEVIVFDRALSQAEILGVEEYLRVKWFLYGDQAVLSAGDVTVAAGAVVDLAGTSQTVSGLSGNGLVTNGTITVAGPLAPGGTNEIGTLTVAAATSLKGGTLLIDAASSGACDRLEVKGSLNLDGGVLLLRDPSQLAVGKRYVIATCAPGELTGTLDPEFEGSGKWKISYDTAGGTVTLVNKGLLIKVR